MAAVDTLTRQEGAAASSVAMLNRSVPPILRMFQSSWVIRMVTLAVILTGWEVFGRRTSTVTFASVTRTWNALWDMAVSGDLWKAWRSDLAIMFTALAISAVAGVFLGFVMGRYRSIDNTVEPVFVGIFMTPKIALLPIIALWLGYQFNAKVLIVILFSFFEVFFTVRDGIKVTNAEYVDVAKAYSIPERMMLTKIVAPATAPYIITGLRLGLLHGMVGVVLAGFFLEANGIGGLISNQTSEFRMHSTFAGMLTVMAVGVAINFSLRLLERRVTPWSVKAPA